jgi:hypothetical protein
MIANFRNKLCAFHKFSLQTFLRLHHHADRVYFFSVNPAGLLSDWFILAWLKSTAAPLHEQLERCWTPSVYRAAILSYIVSCTPRDNGKDFSTLNTTTLRREGEWRYAPCILNLAARLSAQNYGTIFLPSQKNPPRSPLDETLIGLQSVCKLCCL